MTRQTKKRKLRATAPSFSGANISGIEAWSALDWYKMFDALNHEIAAEAVDVAEDAANACVVDIVPKNVDYYYEQIWNLTNEGDVSQAACRRLAEDVCAIGLSRKYITRPVYHKTARRSRRA